MINNWLIVGATGGLGSSIAQELALKGCRLTLLASPKSEELLTANARDLENRSRHEVKTGTVDLGQVNKRVEVFEEMLPEGRPFGVLWAAGVMEPQDELERDPDRARLAHEINYTAAMQLLELAATRMEKAGGGHIVALGSPAGDRGRRSNYLYGADKAALHTLLEGMRHRFAGSNILVTTIKPGPTRTPMTEGMKLPLAAEPRDQAKRIVRALEAGKAVVYAPPVWWPIMCVIRHLPRFIYDKLDL